MQKLRLILPPAQRSYHQQADQMMDSPLHTRGGVTSARDAGPPSRGVTNDPEAEDPPDQPHRESQDQGR